MPAKTMRSDRQALKERLLAKYEQQLDDVLARLDEDTPLDLDEIETMALKTRAEVGQELAQALAETQTAAALEHPSCPDCQQAMVYKGQKRKVIRTLSGEITIQRPYYYCNRCRKGLFPPG
jgi:hypothetical protein